MIKNTAMFNNKKYIKVPTETAGREDETIICLDNVICVTPYVNYDNHSHKPKETCKVSLSLSNGSVLGCKEIYVNMSIKEFWKFFSDNNPQEKK